MTVAEARAVVAEGNRRTHRYVVARETLRIHESLERLLKRLHSQGVLSVHDYRVVCETLADEGL